MATTDGIDEKLTALIDSFKEFKIDFKEWRKCIDADVNGNGKPGLKQRVFLLEEIEKQNDIEIIQIKKKNTFWERIGDLLSNPKIIVAIGSIILLALGTSGSVALNKLNALTQNLSAVEKTIDKIQSVEVTK